jgi:hypothetical protein
MLTKLKKHVQKWQKVCHLNVAPTIYAVVFSSRYKQMAAYMVSQNSRKCRASFVADVAKSVAAKGRVFLVIFRNVCKFKKK